MTLNLSLRVQTFDASRLLGIRGGQDKDEYLKIIVK